MANCLAALPVHAALNPPTFEACEAGEADSALWEIRFFLSAYALWPSPPLPKYVDMPALDPEDAQNSVSRLRRRVRAHFGHEPVTFPLGLCAPTACDAAMVQDVLLPRHMELFFFLGSCRHGRSWTRPQELCWHRRPPYLP